MNLYRVFIEHNVRPKITSDISKWTYDYHQVFEPSGHTKVCYNSYDHFKKMKNKKWMRSIIRIF